MGAITSKLKHSVASAFFNDVALGQAQYYLTEGYVMPWSDEFNPTPPAEDVSQTGLQSLRDEMVYALKIDSDDVSFVLPRVDWTSGTVYNQYDDTADATGTYVLTSAFRVYKCINNNGGAQSTTDPDTQPLPTATEGYYEAADGYVWKFMGILSEGARIRFLSDNFMPIGTSAQKRFNNLGQITAVQIVNAGTGYTLGGTTISVQGDGTGATVDFTLNGDGAFQTITVTNPGSGYLSSYILISGDGTGAELVPIFTATDTPSVQEAVENNAVVGDISNIVVEAGGDEYIAPSVSIVGDGEGATATVSYDVGGAITGVTLTNRGSGYTRATAVITDESGTGASLRVILPPIGGHGSDITSEFGANYLCLFGGDVNQIVDTSRLISNDLRQVSVMRNPRAYGSEDVFAERFGLFAYRIFLDSIDGLVLDGIINIEDGQMRVADIGTDHILALPIDNYRLQNPNTIEQITKTDFSGTYNVIEIELPMINNFTGDILLVNNGSAYIKTDQEKVFHRIYLTF